jgi:hypothetical protein
VLKPISEAEESTTDAEAKEPAARVPPHSKLTKPRSRLRAGNAESLLSSRNPGEKELKNDIWKNSSHRRRSQHGRNAGNKSARGHL